MPHITRSLDIAARPSQVWRHLADQEGLRRWMLPDLEIDLRPGGTYRATGPDGTGITGTVLEIVPEGRLIVSWFEQDAGWVHPARLVVSLQAIATGCRVSLVHDGFAGIGTEHWQQTEAAYERGADAHRILPALADVVESAA